MSNRRPPPRNQGYEEPLSDASMDRAYGQRARGGIQVNWNAIGVIGSFLFSAIAVIVFNVNMNASISTNHALETQSIATQQAAITQLQTNEKENDKSRIEILLHLQSIDQTLKDWTHPAQVAAPPVGTTTIIHEAPAPQTIRPANPSGN